MSQKVRLVTLALAFTAVACDRAPVPTAAPNTAPSFGKTAGRVKNFRIPTDNSNPWDIVLGPDGAMWFTESNFDVGQIGRVDPSGSITEYVVPNLGAQPSQIVSGPDGALWIA